MKLTGLILCFLVTISTGVNAQESSKPGHVSEFRIDTTTTALPEYALEVRRSDGCLVSPISPKTKNGYVLYTPPRHPEVVTDAFGQPLVSKIFVWARQRGEQWDVRVSIGTGEFYDAGDKQLGQFKLNLNERANINNVARFPLNPLQVGVVKIIRQQAGNPTFNNLTQSISLESIEAKELPDPYRLELKNNSSNDLIALQYNTFRRQQFLDLKWLSNGLRNPLIKAGEIYTLAVNSEDRTCGDEDGYRANQSSRIDLVSAVFADGTYEGEPGLPALIKGTALGNRMNLARVVETLRNSSGDPNEFVAQLKNLDAGMNEEVDPYAVEMLLSMLPTFPRDSNASLKGFIRSGMHEVKVNLSSDAQRLEVMKLRTDADTIKKWIARTKDKYTTWLTAAENMTSH